MTAKIDPVDIAKFWLAGVSADDEAIDAMAKVVSATAEVHRLMSRRLNQVNENHDCELCGEFTEEHMDDCEIRNIQQWVDSLAAALKGA